MAEQRKVEDDVYQIRMGSADVQTPQSAWMDAIRELEGTKPVAHGAPAPPPAPVPSSSLGERSLPPTEDELLAAAIRRAARASRMLANFRKARPYLIAPNVYDLWFDHLKETMVLLEREQTRLSSGKSGSAHP